MPEQENITELLLEFSNGKAIAVDALLPIDLRRVEKTCVQLSTPRTKQPHFTADRTGTRSLYQAD